MRSRADRIDPAHIEKAIAQLEQSLRASGYDRDEVGSIAQGAREHVEELIANDPSVSEGELIAFINGFSDPEIAASPQPPDNEHGLTGKFALASALVGIAILIAAFLSADPDLGGALMLLGTLLGGGLACVLGFLSRRSQTGKIAIAMGAALWLCLFVFLAVP